MDPLLVTYPQGDFFLISLNAVTTKEKKGFVQLGLENPSEWKIKQRNPADGLLMLLKELYSKGRLGRSPRLPWNWYGS